MFEGTESYFVEVSAESVPFAGDFYNHEEEVCRGVTVQTAADLGLGVPDDVNKQLAKQKAHVVRRATEAFQPTDMPPRLPEDWNLAASTTYQAEAPFIVGNRIIDFLEHHMDAQIKKVRRQKFTLKAEVLCHTGTCEFKVRAYELQSSSYAFEFRRARGDCLAFQWLFRQLKQHLCPDDSNQNCADFCPPSASLLAQTTDVESSNTLLPLVDMIQNTPDVSVQAEAAAGLANAAQEAGCAHEFCTEAVCAAIRHLLEVNSFAVLCQVARLVSILAQSPVAESCFVDEGLLALLIDKTAQFVIGPKLEDQLSCDLENLASRFAYKLDRDLIYRTACREASFFNSGSHVMRVSCTVK